MTVRIGVIEVVEIFEETPRRAPEGGLGALRTERGNLPLELIEVRSSVAGLAVRTELAQGFRNPYDVPLEATYIFPLPDRAAVTRLRMEAADRVVEGVVKERESARADYSAAIEAGQRASIAEEERPGVFTLRVGNIMPGEHVVIRTTLSGRLPYEDGQATFRFPLVVAPRYIPGAALPGEQVGSGTAVDTSQVPDASRISPPILLPGFPNPIRLSIEVAVDPAGLPLAGLTSSLHGVSVTEEGSAEESGERYVVRLDPGARADRDFILRLAYGGSAAATSLAVAWDEDENENENENEKEKEKEKETEKSDSATRTGTFLLTVLPPELTGATRPRDVALVLDRSGSMGGWKMTAARRAAARIVDSLTATDRFAVLTFDHSITYPDDLPSDVLSSATDRHRFRAVQHLASVEARGGTEMRPALSQAVKLLGGDDPERDKVLVLVTDGQIGDEDSLLSALAPQLTHLRVHTVGIDSAVNAGFLRRLAGFGGGHCELVESEDRLDEAMDAIHRRIGTPLVTGLRLAGNSGLELDQDSITPTRLADLFVGAPLVVAGRFHGATASPGTALADIGAGIVITGEAADGSPWTRRVPALETADAGLAQFWARGRIRDLEDRYVSASQGQPDIERAIVATSVGHSVLSRFTAFVAIDTRVVAAGSPLKQVTQPVDLPAGWSAPAVPAAVPRPMRKAAVYMGTVMEDAVGDAMEPEAYSFSTLSVQPGGSALFRLAPPPPSPGAPTPSRGPMPPSAEEDLEIPDFLKSSVPAPAPTPAPVAERKTVPPAADLRTFATEWLPRFTAAATDGQEALLLEFTAKLTELIPGLPAEHQATASELLSTLSSADKPVAERWQSTVTFLESFAPPARRPFWKR
ncbi:VWA domain-containing protein [Catenulispora sp. NF23]|uniref:VWA domain-containing protein n=1 Tax=Catenulispora pinistramenti TaxID=2705254 RepID=A0ABS5KVE1_9ACTN|nr:VIT domain-containing protein [Catenulispora pinistramenti]MBS2534972.1 VWA domain-containing protein [Catenulispora pinistramenti]MBS2550027.1 VWA domain-containing protein [Catenulispora pinistramenti]